MTQSLRASLGKEALIIGCVRYGRSIKPEGLLSISRILFRKSNNNPSENYLIDDGVLVDSK